MLTPNTLQDLSELLSFLGNEQRLRILGAVAEKEKYAREISEELGISRPLVTIYLKQLEKRGLVIGTGHVTDDPPLIKRYYKAVPFTLVVDLDGIKNLHEEERMGAS